MHTVSAFTFYACAQPSIVYSLSRKRAPASVGELELERISAIRLLYRAAYQSRNEDTCLGGNAERVLCVHLHPAL